MNKKVCIFFTTVLLFCATIFSAEQLNFDWDKINRGLFLNLDVRDGVRTEQQLTDQERADLAYYREYKQMQPRMESR